MSLPDEFFMESGSVEGGAYMRRLRWWLVDAAEAVGPSGFEVAYALYVKDGDRYEVSVQGELFSSYYYQTITVNGEHYDGETLDRSSYTSVMEQHEYYLPVDFMRQCESLSPASHEDVPAWMKMLDEIGGAL